MDNVATLPSKIFNMDTIKIGRMCRIKDAVVISHTYGTRDETKELCRQLIEATEDYIKSI